MNYNEDYDEHKSEQPRQKFRTFHEFWPFYIQEHSLASTRRVHFLGTTLALILIACAVVFKSGFLAVAALVAGYGFAWVSHFFLEKNKPATFQYPLYSLRGDFKMWKLMLLGRVDSELRKLRNN